MQRSVIVRTPAEANRFFESLASRPMATHRGSGSLGLGLSDWLLTSGSSFLSRTGLPGSVHLPSQTRRELLVHERESAVLQMTREYLDARMPLARFAVRQPARLTWHHLPVVHESRGDAFLGFLRSIDAARSLAAADHLQGRDGASFLYIDAPGDPATPLSPSTRRWNRLAPIPAGRVHAPGGSSLSSSSQVNVDSFILDESGDPLLRQHGFEFLDVTLSPAENAVPTQVHGSRLVLVNDDPAAAGDWWWTPPILDNLHDTLWDLADVLWSRKRIHFEGDPIVVEVPLENEVIAEFWTTQLDETQRDSALKKVRDGLRSFMRGGRSVNLATSTGFKTHRLGHGELPDPTADYRETASLVSNAMGGFPVNSIMASSRGSERVDESDMKSEATWARDRKGLFAEPLLDHLFLAARRSGVIPARTPTPSVYHWLPQFAVTPNELATIHKVNTQSMERLDLWGRVGPPELAALYPRDESVAHRPYFAGRGRNEDGSSADEPSSMDEPGSANGPNNGGAGASALSEWDIRELVARRVEAELEEALAEAKD